MKQAAFAYSFQGASHKKKEINPENYGRKFPCQDRAFSGEFDSSEVVEKKEIDLFVKGSHLASRIMLPVKMCPHKTAFSLLCVADGHGGAAYFRSERGAEFAIQAAVELLSESIDKIDAALQEKNYIKANKSLSKSFVRRWIRKIIEDINSTQIEELMTQIETLKKDAPSAAEEYEKDLEKGKQLANRYVALHENAPSESEENTEINAVMNDFYVLSLKSMYGCTSVVYFRIKNSMRWYAFKIGDSDFFASFNSEGGFVKPIKDDPECFLNVTSSLCNDNASQKFYFPDSEYLEKLPVTVFCSTDGVANSFQGENFLAKFYNKIQFMFDEEGKEKAESEIKEYLPKLSETGSSDDISLAGFVSYDDSIEAKAQRRKTVMERAYAYWNEDNYTAILPLFKPYLDKDEFDFKWKNVLYDLSQTGKLAKLKFNKDFIEQWNKTYLNFSNIMNDLRSAQFTEKINHYRDKLTNTMKETMENDITNSLNSITPKYIDDLFNPFINSELNQYSYYKAFYEYKWLKKCFEMKRYSIFYDAFKDITEDMTRLVNPHTFEGDDNVKKYLADLYRLMSQYWAMQK